MIKMFLTLVMSGCLVFSILGQAFAQNTARAVLYDAKSDTTVFPKEIDRRVNVAGWSIPNAVKLEVDQSKSKTNTEYFSGIRIAITKLNIVPNQELQSNYFGGPSGRETQTSQYPWLVKNLFAYENNDHIFAYRADFVPLIITEGGKKQSAAVVIAFFVDQNGDGIFEEYYNSLRLLEIPEWVNGASTSLDRSLRQRPARDVATVPTTKPKENKLTKVKIEEKSEKKSIRSFFGSAINILNPVKLFQGFFDN